MSYLREKQCGTKKAYPTKAAAKLTLRRMTGIERRGDWNAYRCDFCRGFHLGHKWRSRFA